MRVVVVFCLHSLQKLYVLLNNCIRVRWMTKYYFFGMKNSSKSSEQTRRIRTTCISRVNGISRERQYVNACCKCHFSLFLCCFNTSFQCKRREYLQIRQSVWENREETITWWILHIEETRWELLYTSSFLSYPPSKTRILW